MKLSQQAYSIIKSMILDNKFKINQQLLVEEAVEICGFSRTPVREALLRLQEDGLIKLHPRHGLRICAISRRDIEELYELIAHLEVTAIELCIRHTLTPEQINKLREYTLSMQTALEAKDIYSWANHDKHFHEAIFDFTGNSRLIDTARKYNEQNKRCKDIVLKLRPLPWDSVNEHNELIDLIEAGDAPKVREVHLKHWREVSKQFIVYLENYHFLDN